MSNKRIATSDQLQVTLLFFLIVVFVAFLYTFLHEGGHALVGILSGGTLRVFNVSFLDLGAHVEMDVNFTRPQLILNNLAGVSLPILVWLAFILLVPRRANFALESLKVAGSLMFLSPLIAWMVLPMLYWSGQAPSDDAINFLNNSGVHPLVVSASALLIFCGAWALWRTRIEGLRQEIDLFRRPQAAPLTLEVRRTGLALLGVFFMCGLAAFSANGFRFSTPPRDVFQPPQGYKLVQQIRLTPQDQYAQSTVYSFEVSQPSVMGVYLLVENIQAELADFKLTGPDGVEIKLLHAEGYTAYRDNPHIEKYLSAGQYHCVLSTRATTGTLSIYLKQQP